MGIVEIVVVVVVVLVVVVVVVVLVLVVVVVVVVGGSSRSSSSSSSSSRSSSSSSRRCQTYVLRTLSKRWDVPSKYETGSQKCCKNLTNTRLDPPPNHWGTIPLGWGGVGVRGPGSCMYTCMHICICLCICIFI